MTARVGERVEADLIGTVILSVELWSGYWGELDR